MKKLEIMQKVLLAIWIAMSVFLIGYRILFGVDITDESFYVAEAISVLKGNIPYTYVNIKTCGNTFLLLPLLKCYMIYNPSLEGVVLYTRIAFMGFYLLILCLSYFILHKKHNKVYLIFSLGLMTSVWGIAIPNLSYNTISCWLLFLTGIVQLGAFEEQNDGKLIRSAIYSGILVAFAEFAHPGQIANVLFYGITFLIFSEKAKYRNFLIYILTGAFVAVMVVSIIGFIGGWEEFLFGVDTILNYGNRSIKPTLKESLKSLWESYEKEMLLIFLCIGFDRFLRIALRTLEKLEPESIIFKKIKKTDEWSFCHTIGLLIYLCIAYVVFQYSDSKVLLHLGVILGSVSFIYLIRTFFKGDKTGRRILLLLTIFPLLLFVITGFFTKSGPVSRVAQCTMVLFGIALYLEPVIIEHKKNILKAGLVGSLCLCSAVCMYSNYIYVYRDDKMELLDYRVEKGIYKGLYTSCAKAKATIELEEYIKANTGPEDQVMFLDTVPMAYLMTEGIPCVPSTWDRMQYSYRNSFINKEKASETIYRYFENKKKTPDIIIYIDFGRDNQLSIEEEGYVFNSYIEENYLFESEEELNDFYRTKKYIRKKIQ